MQAATAQDAVEALDHFGRILCLVDDHAWTSPTPCVAWNVHDLVNHVVATTTKFSQFAEGSTDAPRTPTADMLGDDPTAAFADACGRSIDAWLNCDPRRICHLPFGQFPAFEAAAINVFDVVVHAWDLATAVGAAPRPPPSRLVELAASVADRLVTEEAVSLGFYAWSPSEAGVASAWGRTLRRTGRSVHL